MFSTYHNQRQYIVFDLTWHKVIEAAGDDSIWLGVSVFHYNTRKRHVPGERYKSPRQTILWQYNTKHHRLVNGKGSSFIFNVFQCFVLWPLARESTWHAFIKHSWATPLLTQSKSLGVRPKIWIFNKTFKS